MPFRLTDCVPVPTPVPHAQRSPVCQDTMENMYTIHICDTRLVSFTKNLILMRALFSFIVFCYIQTSAFYTLKEWWLRFDDPKHSVNRSKFISLECYDFDSLSKFFWAFSLFHRDETLKKGDSVRKTHSKVGTLCPSSYKLEMLYQIQFPFRIKSVNCLNLENFKKQNLQQQWW